MARVAIVTVGIASHVNACLEAARQLVAAGHSVTFLSPRPAVAAQAERCGHEFVPLDDVPAGHSIPGKAATKTERVRRRKLRAEAALEGHGIGRYIDAGSADLFLVDSEFNAVVLHLLARGIRPALLEYHLCPRRVPGIPPLSSTRVPASVWRSRLACWVDWELTLIKRRFTELRELGTFGRACKWAVWRNIARQQNVDLAAVATRKQWPLLFYPSLAYLCLAPAELCFPGEVVKHFDYVGPMVSDARRQLEAEADTDGVLAWLAERGATSRPLVVCAMGSILSLPDFNARMLAAARGADFDLLLAVGRGADPARLGELPPNVHAVEFLPLLTTLDHATMLVFHGGIATTHECILAGVPMLACSAGLKDENGNAARLAYHGVGLSGDLRASPGELRALIERVLSESAFRASIAVLREQCLAYARDGRLVRRVEALLASGVTGV